MEAGSREDARDTYALPSYARKPRRRLSIGVGAVIAFGLGAVGLAGFLTVAALIEPSGEHGRPVASSGLPGGNTAPVEETAEETDGAEEPTGTSDTGDVLSGNALYTTGELVEVACPAPSVDIEDAASMERFLHTMTTCMDRSWSQQFDDADLEFQAPNRIYWYASGQSPCGKYPSQGTAAFYCQANRGLYLGVKNIVHKSGHNGNPEAYTFLLSHEYAHHVQSEAGILGHYHAGRGAESVVSSRDAWTRKSELQANCLGAAFLGSIRASFPIGSDEEANILEDAERRGDFTDADRTHGSPRNSRLWTAHGMDRRDPASCNTWQARSDLVQ
ncbi:neutral zinc metallopeptidase [Salinactinospora qingdaonensis]|uniref:Neutral zinc metallopeptidase n=1 Tax=Salinactinospora qingdaonensis TaxID=702744 RepID=A0ABP7F7A1_9ACTN